MGRKGTISESLTPAEVGAGTSVDRAAGVIRGVKLLGFASRNNRRYERAGVESALKSYDGVALYVNHPTDPATGRVVPKRTRMSEERLGRIENPTLSDAGARCDIRILKSHPMAERLLEAAESMPDAFGLSHNIDYAGHQDPATGELVVESITHVRSVDLVPNPATTNSLFESVDETHGGRRPMRTTLSRLVRSVASRTADKPKAKRLFGFLAEMDEADDIPMDYGDLGADGDASVMDEDPAADDTKTPDEHLADGFKAAIMACVDDLFDGEADPKEVIAKFKKLVETHYKLTGDMSDTAADTTVTEPPVEEEEEPAAESFAEVMRELESRGVTPTASLVESLMHTPPKHRGGLLDRIAGKADHAEPKSAGLTPPARRKQGQAAESSDAEPQRRKKIISALKPGKRATVHRIPE